MANDRHKETISGAFRDHKSKAARLLSQQPYLDSYDRKILEKIATDGRISWRQLAEHINLSHTPTRRRVRRLERDGLIQGYLAIVNERKLFGTFSSLILVSVEERFSEEFETLMLDTPQVILCAKMEGKGYLLNIYARTIEEFRSLVHYVSGVEGIIKVRTRPILKILLSPKASPV